MMYRVRPTWPSPVRQRLATAVLAAAVALAACGSDSGTTSDAEGGAGVVPNATDLAADPAGAAEAMVTALEQAQQSQGGGSAHLVVGDQEWTFTSVLCAFGEEQIGQAGAEFVLSSIQDGMQMYASIDKYGHSISLNDVTNFENPSVGLRSVGDGFIVLDGKAASAEADFVDETGDGFTPIHGTFEAVCP